MQIGLRKIRVLTAATVAVVGATNSGCTYLGADRAGPYFTFVNTTDEALVVDLGVGDEQRDVPANDFAKYVVDECVEGRTMKAISTVDDELVAIYEGPICPDHRWTINADGTSTVTSDD